MTTTNQATLQYNIEQAYLSCWQQEIEQGSKWYAEAWKIANHLAEITVYPALKNNPVQCAALIAVISPRMNWNLNIKLAYYVAQGYDVKGLLTNNKRKALAIANGCDIEGTIGDTSPKVFAFWKSIIAQGNTEHVCVDRHAARAARNTNSDVITAKEYREIEQAYQAIAHKHNVQPAILQAIVWVRVRGNGQVSLWD